VSTASNTQTTKASWALFEGLFIIAALVAVFATFIAMSGAAPNDPTDWLGRIEQCDLP
jgi:two-component system nitrogen regulation sensor histidine kinase NtrY